MERRTFLGVIAGGLLAAPLAGEAQQAGKVPRIGFLSVTSPSDRPPLLDAFRQGLRELGWVEGQNIVIKNATETIPIVMIAVRDPSFLASPTIRGGPP
jgi:putative ABC transport system substrate-binding protein